jgi:hypothetical protein
MVHYNSSGREGEAASVVSELEGLGVEAASHQADLTKRRRDHEACR